MSEEKIHQEHDKGYKHLLQSKRAFMDLLKSFVKTDWVELIEEDDLVRVDKSFILQDFSGKEADIVYRSSIKGQDIIFYVLLELQSTVDYQMPWRLFQYMSEIWRDVLKNTLAEEAASKDYRLPAIIPLVLYNGSGAWTTVKSFREYQKGHELFGNALIDFNYSLINVKSYTEQDLLELATLMSGVFYLDQGNNKDEFVRRLRILFKDFNNLCLEDQRLLVGWVYNIGQRRIGQDINIDELIDTSEGGMTVVHALERIIENERVEGISEGEKKKAEEIARNMISINLDIPTIVKVTGLSEEEVIELMNQKN